MGGKSTALQQFALTPEQLMSRERHESCEVYSSSGSETNEGDRSHHSGPGLFARMSRRSSGSRRMFDGEKK